MNLNRTIYQKECISVHGENVNRKLDINSNWLLGFIEGEGTFGIKNLVPYFQIAQHSRNTVVMDSIKFFIENLPKIFKETSTSQKPKISRVINKNTNVISDTLNDIDILYDFLYPFLNNLKFQSRKKVDFKY